MSAAQQLWIESRKAFLSYATRYWLLVARPEEYFDKHIRRKGARELWETIKHTLFAITVVTLLFGATFGFKLLADKVPVYLQLVLTKQYPFLLLMLLATIPALLLYSIVYRVISAPISDLMFIYFNVLTLWILIFFGLIVCWLVIGIILLPFGIAARITQITVSDTWLYLVLAFFAWPISTLLYTVGSSCYYVPMLLLQKSTERSTLFASALCIAGLFLCLLLGLSGLQLAGFYPSQAPPVIRTE